MTPYLNKPLASGSPICLQLLLAVTLTFVLVQSQTEVPTTSTSITFNATLTCTVVQNGTFLKDPAACNAWIQCVDGQPIGGTCASGLFYNRNTNECVPATSIKCYSSNPCATITTDGFVPDPYACNGYYYCSKGKGSRGQCSAGLFYNPNTGLCIKDFICAAPDPDSWCNIIPDGEFFADLEMCQGYHVCENYVLYNGTCPNGYYFSASESVCDYKDKVVCNVPEEHPNLPGQGVCQNAGQFVSDNKTCSGYYYCQKTSTGDFLLIWDQCSNGRFFSPSNGGECVDRLQIVCKYGRCEGMGASNIQLANAPDDGCTGYLICQDGEEIGSGLCPDEEEYYDEVTQRCTASAIAYPACLVAATTTVATTTTAVTTTTIAATTTTTIAPENLEETNTTQGGNTEEGSNSVES